MCRSCDEPGLIAIRIALEAATARAGSGSHLIPPFGSDRVSVPARLDAARTFVTWLGYPLRGLRTRRGDRPTRQFRRSWPVGASLDRRASHPGLVRGANSTEEVDDRTVVVGQVRSSAPVGGDVGAGRSLCNRGSPTSSRQARIARATMVSVGPYPVEVGNTDESVQSMFSTS
jgi:hypothetical protein